MHLNKLLEYAYLAGGFTTRSDFARENAEQVAEASTKGYITTETPLDGFGNVWRLTCLGQSELWRHTAFERENAQYAV